MTSATFEAVLIYGLLLTWLIFSLVFLADAIQTLIYNHKSEKRAKESAARELEYHEQRMKSLDK